MALAAVLLVNTLRLDAPLPDIAPVSPVALDENAAARLGGALQFATVSREPGIVADAEAFRGLHRYLENSFPAAHRALGRELVGQHSLLYTWRGSDPGLTPVMLLAHLDVVPAAARRWSREPFAGEVAGGYVWGRGALDDKSVLIAVLEAVEMLATEDFRPRRTLYLGFGHDEETGGQGGAAAIAALLAARGVRLQFLMDEGLAIVEGLIPGVNRPVALVGVAEKGSVSLKLSVEGVPGHSSMPPGHTAIGVLSGALARLEAHPMPATLDGVAGDLFTSLAPAMPFPQRVLLANRWLTAPLLVRLLADSPVTNASLRTTTAITMVQGGVKENQLPAAAAAVVNFRILPGDSIAAVVAHVRKVIDEPRVAIEILPGLNGEPSPRAPADGQAFELIARSIRQIFPEVWVAPGLVIAATDSRHFGALTDHVYRFAPLRLRPGDPDRIHGIDERIAVDDYAQMIRFYRHLVHEATR
jgi:carboxypeptidase PM20D1